MNAFHRLARLIGPAPRAAAADALGAGVLTMLIGLGFALG